MFPQTYDTADIHNIGPNGWPEWLRKDVIKVIIELADDQSGDELPDGSDPTAANFAALLALTPAQFGRPGNYIFHAIVRCKHATQRPVATDRSACSTTRARWAWSPGSSINA